MKVSDILKLRQKTLIHVTSSITVYDALKVMGENNIGAVPVIENDQLVGIISERDYARKIVLLGKRSHETMVNEIMTQNVITVTFDDKIETCMELMRDKHIRHLPVTQDNKVTAMISIGDVVNAIIESQKETINHLQNYIMQ
jgi:CBS domain-containing protein